MNSADRIGWMFQAEVICDDCIISRLEDAGLASVNAQEVAEQQGLTSLLSYIASVNAWDFDDETTYDSDDFPKVYLVQHAEGDAEAIHCGSCAEELFPDGGESGATTIEAVLLVAWLYAMLLLIGAVTSNGDLLTLGVFALPLVWILKQRAR